MTGSIEKRGKNSYRLVVFKGYDLDGRPIRHQKTIHCKKKSEAQIELAKFLTEVESGLIVDGNIPTFAQYVEIWTKDYALKELALSTYYRYKRMLETRITPYFGHYKLNKIKPTDIMRFYDLLEEDTQIIRRKNNNGKKTRTPLSQKTILEHHRLLSAMLHKAVYWQLIVSNPAERVQPPKTSKPLRRHYDEDQIKILQGEVDKWKNDYYKVFADMENIKRRMQNEHANNLKFMMQGFIEQMLPIVDNFERSLAIENPSEEVANFLKGYEMIYKQIMTLLENQGVKVIEAEGKEFDPNFHQAVMTVSDENFKPGMVVEELQKGYMLKDRVIRASLVKVSE